MKLVNDLFGFDREETKGDYLFFRLFELMIIAFSANFVWKWAFYIPKLGNVVLPLGIANYLDVSFMFTEPIALVNAVLISLLLGLGLFRMNRYSYLVALLLFHLQYTARFSQGEISHGSNMVGMALLGLAVAELAFRDRKMVRKFSLGIVIFFIGLGYTSAAFSKMIGTGITWVDGRHLWLWMGERATDVFSQHGEFSFNLLQQGIMEYRWLGTAILTFGLVTEFLGFTLWFRKTRPFAATLLIGMHFGILLTMNINFPKYVYILILLGYPWQRLFDYLIHRKPDTMLNRLIEKTSSFSGTN